MESEYLELYKSVVSEISKGLEQVKEVKESCSNKEQEGVLERMLSSHEEALLILTGRAPRGKCHSGISSLPDPPASSTSIRGSKYASSRLRKRKIITDTYSVKVETSSPQQDGFAWRKYGKKHMLGAKYPRAYYRCVHKYCSATKQVQRSDDGTVFEVTYGARHTCQEGLSKIIQDGSQKEKKVIEADKSNVLRKKRHFISRKPVPGVPKEKKSKTRAKQGSENEKVKQPTPSRRQKTQEDQEQPRI